MIKIQIYINGELIEPNSGLYLDNINPATGKKYALAPDSDYSDIEIATRSAKMAKKDWANKPLDYRFRILMKIADIIKRDQDKLVLAESIDNEKPLIFGGVMERLPKLRFAFAHGGGSFPSTIKRIQHGFEVRPDLCAVDNRVSPIEYLGKFWVDSLTHDPVMLKYLIDLMDEEKVVFGTDYPFPLGELEPGKLIEQVCDFTPGLKTQLLSTNALSWLNLKKKCFYNDL